MALIACPECGKQISDKAPACIHCGYPINEIKINSSSLSNSLKKVVIYSHLESKMLYITVVAIVKSVKKISFADALVSLYVLQVSLLHEFSTKNHSVFNLITGMMVCVGLVATGVYMIVRFVKIKKWLKDVKVDRSDKP